MFKFNAKTISRIGILAALYVLLNLVSIKAGNIRITFASLPVVTSALLFGPEEAMLTALLGEFCNQLLTYGLTATTVLWLIPPAVRGLVVGLAAVRAWKGQRPLESRPAACYAVCFAGAVATTLSNTAALAADALIGGYYSRTVVFAQLGSRLISGLVVAGVIATVAMPLAVLLRRQGFVRRAA